MFLFPSFVKIEAKRNETKPKTRSERAHEVLTFEQRYVGHESGIFVHAGVLAVIDGALQRLVQRQRIVLVYSVAGIVHADRSAVVGPAICVREAVRELRPSAASRESHGKREEKTRISLGNSSGKLFGVERRRSTIALIHNAIHGL